MRYATGKAVLGVYLCVPGLMLIIYGRVEFLRYSSQPYSSLTIFEATFIAGALGVVIGIPLFLKGWPDTKKGRLILEVASQKKEFTISEISTQTGFSEEYVRKVISDLMKRDFLSGFLNDDRFEQRNLYDG